MEQNYYFGKVYQNDIKSKRDIQIALVLIYEKLIKKRYEDDHNFLPFKITSKRARRRYISFTSKLHEKIP